MCFGISTLNISNFSFTGIGWKLVLTSGRRLKRNAERLPILNEVDVVHAEKDIKQTTDLMDHGFPVRSVMCFYICMLII